MDARQPFKRRTMNVRHLAAMAAAGWLAARSALAETSADAAIDGEERFFVNGLIGVLVLICIVFVARRRW